MHFDRFHPKLGADDSRSFTVEQHRTESPNSVRCMIITVSDSRTPETDRSGALIRSLLEAAQYSVSAYRIVCDDYNQIQLAIKEGITDSSVEAILLNGGTGIAKRDVTYEAVHNLLEKEMHGFGEIFRFLSFTEDIGAAAILSRAIAGVCGHKSIFSMPGSSGAVKLAMSRIIIPELRHVMREIYKDMM